MNGPQALYVNPGCLQCISGINLSLDNENVFIIALILFFKSKEDLTKEFEWKVFLFLCYLIISYLLINSSLKN